MKSIVRACGIAAAAAGCIAAAAFAEPLVPTGDSSMVAAVHGQNRVQVELPQPTLGQLVEAYADRKTGSTEEECLANAVYFEARGEPLDGQLAVADVVLNRKDSGRYPTTICQVVKQPWQFSFVRRGKFPSANRASEAWEKAVAISRIAMEKIARQVPNDVLWYHADYVAPSWGKRLNRETKIGLHIFYRQA